MCNNDLGLVAYTHMQKKKNAKMPHDGNEQHKAKET